MGMLQPMSCLIITGILTQKLIQNKLKLLTIHEYCTTTVLLIHRYARSENYVTKKCSSSCPGASYWRHMGVCHQLHAMAILRHMERAPGTHRKGDLVGPSTSPYTSELNESLVIQPVCIKQAYTIYHQQQTATYRKAEGTSEDHSRDFWVWGDRNGSASRPTWWRLCWWFITLM
jgi:hypothetical protein